MVRRSDPNDWRTLTLTLTLTLTPTLTLEQVRQSDPNDWRVLVEISPDVELPVYESPKKTKPAAVAE